MKTAKQITRASRKGTNDQPVRKLVKLLPAQGSWSEGNYLALTEMLDSHPILELYNGCLEILPMPTHSHQLILGFLYDLLKAHAKSLTPGIVVMSGIAIRLLTKKGGEPQFRGPDIAYMKDENVERCHEKYWDGADLVVEIVSGSSQDRKRDHEEKRREYAAARIPEYWIIDPKEQLVRVLTLKGTTYRVHGEYHRGDEATSVLLPGFEAPVTDMLDARR